MAELKPCPFCGSDNVEFVPEKGQNYEDQTDGFIWCHGCNFSSDIYSKERAAEVWNRRAEPDNPPLTLDELKEMDGEPAWVERAGHDGKWVLVDVSWKSENLVYLINQAQGSDLAEAALINGAKIYRRKPEGGNHETDHAKRLTAYERTGLSPEEVRDLKESWDMYGGADGINGFLEKLKAYEDAEKDGRRQGHPFFHQ